MPLTKESVEMERIFTPRDYFLEEARFHEAMKPILGGKSRKQVEAYYDFLINYAVMLSNKFEQYSANSVEPMVHRAQMVDGTLAECNCPEEELQFGIYCNIHPRGLIVSQCMDCGSETSMREGNYNFILTSLLLPHLDDYVPLGLSVCESCYCQFITALALLKNIEYN